MTDESDSIYGFKLGSVEHNHSFLSSGEKIRKEMIRKGLKRARESTLDTIPKILRELEHEFLTIENASSVDWSTEAVSQMLYRERKKSFPLLLDECDSSKGFNIIKKVIIPN